MQSTVMYGEFKQVFNFTPAPKEVAGVNLTEKKTRMPGDFKEVESRQKILLEEKLKPIYS